MYYSKTTLETSGEDVDRAQNLFFSAVRKSNNFDSAFYEAGRLGLWKILGIYTRFECNFTFSSLVSCVVLHLLHSFRV